jgi:hypothetical protein
MRRLSPLLTILVLPFVIQARDVYYQGDLAPLNILPTFDKGYLAVYEPEHTIALYEADGSLAYRAKALVPGVKYIDVANAAPEADGSLAIAVEYRIENYRAAVSRSSIPRESSPRSSRQEQIGCRHRFALDQTTQFGQLDGGAMPSPRRAWSITSFFGIIRAIDGC